MNEGVKGADQIVISELELQAQIGVPEAERKHSQRLTVEMWLTPKRDFRDLGDEIGNTVDYFTLTRRIQELARERPRKLIETLVQEVAECLLGEFPLREVEVELRKYILPDTAYVAVRVSRRAEEP